MSSEVKSVFQNIAIEKITLKSFFLKSISDSTKNYEYFINYGLDSNAFTSNFRISLFEMVKNHYNKYSVTPSNSIILILLKKQYRKDKDSLERNKTLFIQILDIDFDETNRHFFYSEIKQIYLYRQLHFLHNDGLTYLNQVDHLNKTNYSPEQNIKDTIDRLTGLLVSKSNQIREGDIFQDVTVMKEIIYKRNNPELTRGIDTGIDILTSVTNGWQGGELILIAGRPGQGKSVLMSNFAYKAFDDTKNVMIVSLEMPFRQQQYRVYSQAFNIPYAKIKTPSFLSDEDLDYLTNSIDEKSKRKNRFFVVDAPTRCTTLFIDNKITELETKYDLHIDLVVIDPIYLMRSVESSDKRDRDDPVGMISGEIKILAMKRGIPFICATQINREGGTRHKTGKTPDASDLSFSDRLGHNADMIFIITSDPSDLSQLHIVKFRDGAGPKIILKKKFSLMKFEYDEYLNEKKELEKYLPKHAAI